MGSERNSRVGFVVRPEKIALTSACDEHDTEHTAVTK